MLLCVAVCWDPPIRQGSGGNEGFQRSFTCSGGDLYYDFVLEECLNEVRSL